MDARKILLAALLFMLGWATMQVTRCDGTPGGAGPGGSEAGR